MRNDIAERRKVATVFTAKCVDGNDRQKQQQRIRKLQNNQIPENDNH